MARPWSTMAAAALLAAPVAHAGGAPKAPAQWPVADMQTVAAASYAEGAAAAAGGADPIAAALKIVGPFDGSMQQLVQTNERVEAPRRATVVVIRDGLPDDAIRAERWDIRFDRGATGAWTIGEVKRAWSCRRGVDRERFATARCP